MATYNVATEVELRTALAAQQNGDSIIFTANITLATDDLQAVTTTMTVDAAGFTLSGGALRIGDGGTAGSLTGGVGAAATGYSGTIGDTGSVGTASAALAGAGATLAIGTGSTVTGGTGGAGRALVAGDAQSVTSTPLGINGNLDLGGQGFALTDQIIVRLGFFHPVSSFDLNGETLASLAAAIAAHIPTISVSATTTGTNDTLTISQGTTVIETITLANNIGTPMSGLGFTGPFPQVIAPLFEDGGVGGTGAAGAAIAAAGSGVFEIAGTLRGGVGGAGGGTLFREGDGGNGGTGGAG
ncbi:MAG: hypothetical protein KJ825_10680, partial [Alphaproteobacteria bacterium]|nr:hypothetical protein [Alphaproteobacteria bacterium]